MTTTTTTTTTTNQSSAKAGTFAFCGFNAISCCLIVLLGSVIMGMSIGFTGTYLYELRQEQTLTAKDAALIASLYNVGTILTNVPFGVLGNRYGRKPVLVFGSILACAGWIVVAVSGGHVGIICAGRLLQGGSSCTALTQVFVSELPSKELRGLYGGMNTFGVFTGVTTILVLGALFHWQVVCLICAGLCLLHVGLMATVVPESPYWLSTQGRFEESERTLRWLRKDDEQVLLEMNDLKKTHALSSPSQGSIWEQMKDLKDPGTLKALNVLLIILFLSFSSGGATMVFYIVNIFQSLGFGQNPYLPSITVSLIRNLSALVGGGILRYAKRRTFLIVSAMAMALSISLVGVLMQFKEDIVRQASWMGPVLNVLVIGLIVVFAVMFSLGVTSIPMVLIGELCPLKVRGLVSGPASLAMQSGLFLSNMTFNFLVETIGIAWTFQTFTAQLILLSLFAYFCLRETKGKTQEELAKLYS